MWPTVYAYMFCLSSFILFYGFCFQSFVSLIMGSFYTLCFIFVIYNCFFLVVIFLLQLYEIPLLLSFVWEKLLKWAVLFSLYLSSFLTPLSLLVLDISQSYCVIVFPFVLLDKLIHITFLITLEWYLLSFSH